MPPPTAKPLSPLLSAFQRAVLRTRSFRGNPAKGYTAAVLIIAAVLGVKVTFADFLQGLPFLLFFPGIIVATFAGGVGAGILAVVSSALAVWYFILPPFMGFDWGPTTIVALGLFVAAGAFGAVLVGWLIKIAEHIADFAVHEQELLRELQHRVKNHVQIVSSLLQIQARRADAGTQAALNEACRRLATISTVYGSLYRSGHQIDFKTHLEELCHVASRAAPDTQSEFKVDAEPVSWGMDLVMPLSLIACELIANAIQHGSRGGTGRVEIALKREGGNVTLTVSDSGARLPDGFDVEKEKGLGLQLARTLSRQIQGKISVRKDTKTHFIVEFPETPKDPH